MSKPRRHRCTWCGELDHDMVRKIDAADRTHYFHEKCRTEMGQWFKSLAKMYR